MAKYYTTEEAALYLTERGFTAREGGPVTARTVQHWCIARNMVATREGGKHRGQWLIAEDELAGFVPPKMGQPVGTKRPSYNPWKWRRKKDE